MKRQVFLRLVSVAASSVIVGCGDSSSDGSGGATGNACQTLSSNIGSNHGHVLGIPPGDVTAGVDKTYDIKGTSVHTHTVTITAAMFQSLAAGDAVTVESSRIDHLHSVSITCVGA